MAEDRRPVIMTSPTVYMTSQSAPTRRMCHEGQEAAGRPVQDRVEAVGLAAYVGVAVVLLPTGVLPAWYRLELPQKKEVALHTYTTMLCVASDIERQFRSYSHAID